MPPKTRQLFQVRPTLSDQDRDRFAIGPIHPSVLGTLSRSGRTDIRVHAEAPPSTEVVRLADVLSRNHLCDHGAAPDRGKSQEQTNKSIESGERKRACPQSGERFPLVRGKGAIRANKPNWNQKAPFRIQGGAFAQESQSKTDDDACGHIDDESPVGEPCTQATGDCRPHPVSGDGSKRTPYRNDEVFLQNLVSLLIFKIAVHRHASPNPISESAPDR